MRDKQENVIAIDTEKTEYRKSNINNYISIKKIDQSSSWYLEYL